MTNKKSSLREAVNALFGSKSGPEKLAALDAKISQLQNEREELVDELRRDIQFEQVLPDQSNTDIHEQLIDKERVHPLSSLDELIQKRIGGEDSNKRCFARIVRNGKPEVNACIYTAFIKLDTQESINYQDIPGHIETVKNMDAQPTKFKAGDNVSVILYSISSNSDHDWEKGGRPLANAIYNYITSWSEEHECNTVISTLSPIRNVTDWLEEQDGFTDIKDHKNTISSQFLTKLDNKNHQQAIKKQVLTYLLTEKDPVLNFHLGNGAYIGDIKLNNDNKKDWVMINYVYPTNPQQRENNQSLYANSKIRLIAPHLNDLLGHNNPELHRNSSCISHTASIGSDSRFKPPAPM